MRKMPDGTEITAQKVKEAQSGDADAFYEAFCTIQRLVYKIVLTRLSDREDALDAFQECACRAYKHINELRDPFNFKAWVCKIALNVSVEYSKNNNKRLFAAEEIQNNTDGAESSDFRFMDMLSRLSAREKDILILKFYFEYTFGMIADEKQIPVNTVKSVYYRAIEKLRLTENCITD